jgi:hypothetical protein
VKIDELLELEMRVWRVRGGRVREIIIIRGLLVCVEDS